MKQYSEEGQMQSSYHHCLLGTIDSVRHMMFIEAYQSRRWLCSKRVNEYDGCVNVQKQRRWLSIFFFFVFSCFIEHGSSPNCLLTLRIFVLARLIRTTDIYYDKRTCEDFQYFNNCISSFSWIEKKWKKKFSP